MLKKAITYTDYEGRERTEDFYFNLNKIEILEMDAQFPGGLEKRLEHIANTEDAKSAIELFKDLIMRAYGEKSPDGKRFIKSKELSEGFVQTEAYSELLMGMLSDANEAAKFVNGMIPAKLAEAVAAQTDAAEVKPPIRLVQELPMQPKD